MTFAKGAALTTSLQLEPRWQRQACYRHHEGEKIDEAALKALIRNAVAVNVSRARR